MRLGYLLYQASKFHREFIFENWILSSGRGIGQRFILCLTPGPAPAVFIFAERESEGLLCGSAAYDIFLVHINIKNARPDY